MTRAELEGPRGGAVDIQLEGPSVHPTTWASSNLGTYYVHTVTVTVRKYYRLYYRRTLPSTDTRALGRVVSVVLRVKVLQSTHDSSRRPLSEAEPSQRGGRAALSPSLGASDVRWHAGAL